MGSAKLTRAGHVYGPDRLGCSTQRRQHSQATEDAATDFAQGQMAFVGGSQSRLW